MALFSALARSLVSKVSETILYLVRYMKVKDPVQSLQGKWAYLFTIIGA